MPYIMHQKLFMFMYESESLVLPEDFWSKQHYFMLKIGIIIGTLEDPEILIKLVSQTSYFADKSLLSDDEIFSECCKDWYCSSYLYM